jgi:hypothetical protein
MDRARAIFIDGIGAASTTTGVLNQLQGRIFALLYLEPQALTLHDIARELEQAGRGRRVTQGPLRGAATNLWQVMSEIMERRFRWNLRQVLTTVEETPRANEERAPSVGKTEVAFLQGRLEALRAFFAALDTGIGARSIQEKGLPPKRSKTSSGWCLRAAETNREMLE